LVGFQDSFNEVLHEDDSLDKESNASVRIIKPPPIKLVKHHLATHVERKFSTTNNAMVEVVDRDNKMLVALIDKIHSTNLGIEKQCSQAQKEL
jgi:hypothetical protein